MLKFLNAEKTAVEFEGAYFSLKAPEDWDSIGDGPTREAVKTWLAAGNAPVEIAPPSIQDQITALKAEIETIERNDLMNRRAREAFILQAEQIAASQYNMTPEQLYQANPGYKGAKDIDNQIKALRAQISALEDQQ